MVGLHLVVPDVVSGAVVEVRATAVVLADGVVVDVVVGGGEALYALAAVGDDSVVGDGVVVGVPETDAAGDAVEVLGADLFGGKGAVVDTGIVDEAVQSPG